MVSYGKHSIGDKFMIPAAQSWKKRKNNIENI